jgi:DNA-binding NarL/FixJ family response regulator
VLLADDHELAREAMRSVLSRESDLEVVGEARDGREAVALSRALSPELVVLDLAMPVVDGMTALREILTIRPSTRIVVLTAHDRREYVVHALRAGAAGYLLKDSSKQEVLATLRAALAGETHVGSGLAAQLLRQEARDPAVALSERELEVLRLMARGRTNEQIGRELHLSLNTIKTHVSRILHKLDVPDRAAAVARGAHMGLIRD